MEKASSAAITIMSHPNGDTSFGMFDAKVSTGADAAMTVEGEMAFQPVGPGGYYKLQRTGRVQGENDVAESLRRNDLERQATRIGSPRAINHEVVMGIPGGPFLQRRRNGFRILA